MRFLALHLPEFILTAIGVAIQVSGGISLLRLPRFRNNPRARQIIWLAVALASGLLMAGFVCTSVRASNAIGHAVVPIRLGSLIWLVISAPTWIAWQLLRLVPSVKPTHSPARRKFMLAARGAVLAAPAVATGYGIFIERFDLRLREVDMPVAGLPPELAGLRLVQLSDIHLSPFLTTKELARAVDMANETKAHLGLITGDLITGMFDPLDTCLEQVARLRTEAGSLGCMGNHEAYARAEGYTMRRGAELGIDFLRDRSRILEFRGRKINFAGVDYQKMGSRYLHGTEKLLEPGMPNILLSHNPDVFPVAAEKGFQATISGHTHGGQITVEILHQNLSVARFYTPYVYGLYRKGSATAWVTRGIGTVGIPARLGAPPEVALIRLCAI